MGSDAQARGKCPPPEAIHLLSHSSQNMVLPRRTYSPLSFLQQICCGQKTVLRKHQLREVEGFPAFPETSTEKLWAKAQTCQLIMRCMPDQWKTPKKVDRAFLVKVMSTYQHQYMFDLANDVRQQRLNLRKVKPTVHEIVLVKDEFLRLLCDLPYNSGKHPIPPS